MTNKEIKVNTKLPPPYKGEHPKRNKKGLAQRELLFINKYMETNNITQSAIYAGYSEKTAAAQGSKLLKNPKIAQEITKRREQLTKKSIASAQEVMEYLTRVMNGEEKDQFGLDAPLAERTRAAIELAKRTVDIDNKLNGKADNVIEIKLNWED